MSGVEAVFVDGNRINSLTNGKAYRCLKDYAGTEKQVSVYAEDYAGNRSKTVKLDNPYYEEPAQNPETCFPTAAPQRARPVHETETAQAATFRPNAATSSGGRQFFRFNIGNSTGSTTASQAEIGSFRNPRKKRKPLPLSRKAHLPRRAPARCWTQPPATDGDKQFYTITTEAGNVFYLIIDGKRDDNNVYFLNGVTEADLMALAEKNNGSMSVIPAEDVCNCTEKCEAGEVNTGCPVCKNDLNGCIGKEKTGGNRRNRLNRNSRRKRPAVSARLSLSSLPCLRSAGRLLCKDRASETAGGGR